MDQLEFVYVLYISAPAERIWEALVEPETTTIYWQHVNVSDWKQGSRWEHRRDGPMGEVLLLGKVLEVEAPKRLVISWAFPADEAREDRHTRVSILLEPVAGLTRLSLTHDRLEPGSDMLTGITDGWPKVLSSLKTLMETGRAQPRLW